MSWNLELLSSGNVRGAHFEWHSAHCSLTAVVDRWMVLRVHSCPLTTLPPFFELALSVFSLFIGDSFLCIKGWRLTKYDFAREMMFQGSTKRREKRETFATFTIFIMLSGKLGQIFKVPCSTIFLFWHSCFFCTRTKSRVLISLRVFLWMKFKWWKSVFH